MPDKLYTVTLADGSGDQDLPAVGTDDAPGAFQLIEQGLAKFTNPGVGNDQQEYEEWIETRQPGKPPTNK